MNVLATLSLLACAFPISLEWYFSWRFLSGVATGATIVLVAATFLPHVPADRKGVASGLIFVGLGLGIAATGTLVPFLLRFGLRATWIWLALFAGALTVSTLDVLAPSARMRDMAPVSQRLRMRNYEELAVSFANSSWII
jgi:MFS family permease